MCHTVPSTQSIALVVHTTARVPERLKLPRVADQMLIRLRNRRLLIRFPLINCLETRLIGCPRAAAPSRRLGSAGAD